MLQGLCGFRWANFIKAVHSAVSCTKAQEDVGRSSRERRERLEYPPGPAGGVRSGCRGGQGGLFGPGARGRIVGWLAELCRRSVLGCIKGDVCNERIILQHFFKIYKIGTLLYRSKPRIISQKFGIISGFLWSVLKFHEISPRFASCSRMFFRNVAGIAGNPR